MLDAIRTHSQSWIVKLIFALIVVVFVFWGVGSYNSRGSIVATVNDEAITQQEFREAHEQFVQFLRRQNPQLGQDDLQKMQLKQQVLNQLIDKKLLLQEAVKLHQTVSVKQLRQTIESIPTFAGEDGKFSPEVYKNVLQANQTTPAGFERDMRQGIILEKLQKAFAMPAAVDIVEARGIFDFARSSVNMSYVEFSDSEYEKKAKLPEGAAKAVYESQKEKFMKPQQARFDLLQLTAQDLAALMKITPDEVKEFYESNLDDFKQEERVHARHILFALNKDASEDEAAKVFDKASNVRKKISVKNFATQAKKFSACPTAQRGGDLGWFGRGQMVPPFEEAAFALKKGEISQPIRTDFGYHIIYLEDHAQAKVAALDEVKDSVYRHLQQEKANKNLKEKLDEVVELLMTGSDLEAAAKKIGLSIHKTDLLNKGQAPAGLKLDEKAVASLYALEKDKTATEPIIFEGGYLFARKTEAIEATPVPFKQVKGAIEQQLRQEEGRKLALAAAQEMAENIKNGKLPKAKLKEQKNISRQGYIPNLGVNQKLTNELFAAKVGSWLPEAYEIGQGVVVARLDALTQPKVEEWEAEKDRLKQMLLQNKKQNLFLAAIERLRNNAKITVSDPEFFKK